MDDYFIGLLNCGRRDEVEGRLREFVGRPDNEHLIRSLILDIHANVERHLRRSLYSILVGYVFNGFEDEYERATESLDRMVGRLSFGTVYRILAPLLNAFPADEFADLQRINELRNAVAHKRSLGEITYKGRSPFSDPDCLAQFYFEAWAIGVQFDEFLNTMVLDPRAMFADFERFHSEHFRTIDDQTGGPESSADESLE